MSSQNPIARFRLAGILLAAFVAYGVAGYILLEGWNLGDALYMTVITISTVGYGEVHPLSAAGRVFSVTLIVGGVGTMLYAFGVFAEMLGAGHIASYRRRRNMDRRVAALEGHFIICGYGRIGTQLVLELERERATYIVIDNNVEAVGRLEREGRLHLEGDAASEELLHRAGIERARGLICAVDSDERAVYITLAARALSPNLYLLARAGRPESVRRLELAGANRVISPYRMAGHHLAELALRPATVDVMSMLQHGESEIGVEELIVQPGSHLAGKTIAESSLLEGGAQLLALRRRDGSLHVKPEAELKLEEGDLIVAIGSHEELGLTAARLQ